MKRNFLRFILFCNLATILFLFAADAAPYLNPYTWWPAAIAGLLFPLLLVLVFLFFLFWLFIRPRNAGYSLAAIIISLPAILVSTGGSLPRNFDPGKKKGDLRILTWNTGLMNYSAPDSNAAIRGNAVIFNKLKEADADIVCLQEFFTAVVPGHHLNFIDSVTSYLKYPYHYFSFDWPKFDGKFYSGNILFSRYPISDTQKTVFPGPFVGSVIKASVVYGPDTIDIITSRLQSVHFQREDYQQLHKIKTGSDSSLIASRNIIAKLRMGYKQRVEQVKTVKTLIRNSRHPLVFTGDLNDIPISYTYTQIKDGLSDAWVKKGAGLGRTFAFISPTLRIDYIFFSGQFRARQVKRILGDGASDHHALIADLLLKKSEQ